MRAEQAGSAQARPSRRTGTGDEAGAAKAGGSAPAMEVELKFQVPELAREALADALANCRVSRLKAFYYDTADGRLAEAGISLRLRQVDGQWFQTLKVAQGTGIYARLEHEVPIAGSSDGIAPDLDLARHEGSPAGDALAKFIRQEGDDMQPLVLRHGTDVTRRTWELREGKTAVEGALDLGRVVAGDEEEPLVELELELKSGQVADLCSLARTWAGRYGLWLTAESKAARGERLRAGGMMPVVKASPPRLQGDMSPESALRAVVRSCLDQILANAGAVAAGSRDHDHVHQLRVGLRRLRTAVRELGSLSGDLDSAWEEPLADTFRQLGAYRDREAVLSALKPKLQEAGAGGLAWMEAPGEAVDPVATARDPRFQEALLHFLAFALEEEPGPDSARNKDLSGYLRRRLRSLHRRVVDEGRHFRSLSEEAQHQVRKRLKRLRYLSEFVAPLYGRRSVEAYLDCLRPAQDALGEHNDYAVAGEMARQAAERGDADGEFARRWLDKQRKHSVKASRKALEKIAEAPRFWKKGEAVH